MIGKAAGWAKPVGESPLHLRRLNIGPRLTLCFLLIVLVLLLANGVLILQFRQARAQADRLSGVDQELVTVLQAHTSLMSFYERLDLLAHSENTDELVREVDDLRSALLQDSRRTRNALSHLPPEVQPDPALLPTLWAIQGALPSELEAITVLAKSRDWEAVRLRLANQIRPLEARSSSLVANIDREVGEERAQALLNIGRAQRRILLIVPITGALTLLFAAFLGLAITRSITRPVRQLLEGSAALARGDFSHRVPAEGKDEFARLGDVFNNMIVRLQELYRELQRRESYLAEAQKLSQTGSFGWNPASGEIVWSEETYRIFALDRTTRPTVEFILSRTVPEDRQSVQQLVDTATRERKNWDLEHRIVMPDGAVKHLHVVAHAMHDELSGATEYVGAVMDVTQSKHAEEALRRSAEQLYELRLSQLAREYDIRLEERVGERTRIARELHDSLLQGFQGLMFRLQAVREMLPGRAPAEAIESLDIALERGDKAIAEGRDTVSDLRESILDDADIAKALTALGEELAAQSDKGSVPRVRVLVEGKQRELNPILRDEIYRIGREAFRNAFRHARAQKIEAEITYGDSELLFHVRDDGIGMAPEVADQGGRAGHWGLPGMSERAKSFGGKLEVWSENGAGTEIELTIPAAIAYGGAEARRKFWSLQNKADGTDEQQS